MSNSSRMLASVAAIGFALFAASPSSAQNFPNHTLTMLTSEAGSGADIITRLIQPDLEASLGQPVVVVNHATQLLGSRLADSKNDGYTVGVGGSAIWQEKTAYDPMKAFAPVAMMGSVPFVLVVSPKLPVNSVKDFIDYAKANPGKLNIAITSNLGSSSTFAMDLFKSMTGITYLSVPYNGTVPQQVAVMNGESDAAFLTASTIRGALDDKKIKAIAVASLEPSQLLPGMPTVASAGLPGYSVALTTGVLAPAGAPQEAITRWNQAILAALSKPQTIQKMLSLGVAPAGDTPAEFAADIKSEIDAWNSVAKSNGLANH